MSTADVLDVVFRSVWLIGVLAAAATVGVLVMQHRKHRSRNR